jgi:hypothetical protein
MATLLSSTISLQVSSGESVTQGAVISSPNYQHTSASSATPITNGSGSGQAQGTTSFYYTASTSTAVIDLSAITPSLSGSTANYTAIKGYLFENLDASNSITLSGGTNGTNAWQGFNGSTNVYSVPLQAGGAVAAVQPVTGLLVGGTNGHYVSYIASAASPAMRVSLVGTGSGF